MNAPHRTREVIVKSPRGAIEGGLVFAVLTMIATAAFVRQATLSGSSEPLFLRPYQRLTTASPNNAVRLFELLSNAAQDAADMSGAGRFPSIDELRKAGVPPYDESTLAADLRGFAPHETHQPSWADYRFVRGDAGFILRIIDLHAEYHPHPHPGIDYDPDRRYTYQIWWSGGTRPDDPGERLPEAGWIWIVTPDDPTILFPARMSTPPPPKMEVKR
ncbi:hypothetical protein K8I61_00450 [bacterium]|nr:hypothetical protein [bacterium]